jgi:hypothetical protein
MIGNLPDLPEIRTALARIKSSAQLNQALLIHARACLKGALQIATGAPDEPASYPRTAGGHPPVRVNLSG